MNNSLNIFIDLFKPLNESPKFVSNLLETLYRSQMIFSGIALLFLAGFMFYLHQTQGVNLADFGSLIAIFSMGIIAVFGFSWWMSNNTETFNIAPQRFLQLVLPFIALAPFIWFYASYLPALSASVPAEILQNSMVSVDSLRNLLMAVFCIAIIACFAQSYTIMFSLLSSLLLFTVYEHTVIEQSAYLFFTKGVLVVVGLICGYFLSRTVSKAMNLKFKTEELATDLRAEVDTRREAQTKLHNANQNLERLVSLRTRKLAIKQKQLEASKERLSMALAASDTGLWDWDVAGDKLLQSNFAKKFGYGLKEFSSQKDVFNTLVHPDDQMDVKRKIIACFKGKTNFYHAMYRLKHKNGEWRWIEDTGKALQSSAGKVKRMVGTRRDITEQYNEQQRKYLLSEVFKSAPDVLFILDRNFRYIDVNEHFQQSTGFSYDEIIDKSLIEDGKNILANSIYKPIKLAVEEMGTWEGETIGWNAEGKSYSQWLKINTVNAGRSDVYYIGASRDITELKEIQNQLDFLSRYDRLTGFANKDQFKIRIAEIIEQQPNSVVLMNMTIDRYKRLNSVVGALVADQVVKQISERIGELGLNTELMARTSNEEFVFIYVNARQPSILKDAEAIIDTLRQPFFVNDTEFVTSVSIGISEYPQHAHDHKKLYAQSLTARQHAKKLGGNTYQVYRKESHATRQTALELESRLRQALDKNELEVFYQPKLNLKTKRVHSVESLVRWRHPENGLLMPGYFIPIAEESGLINDIGLFVLEKSCQQVAMWREQNGLDVSVAVNISAQQLYHEKFIRRVEEMVEEYGLEENALELEITESQLLSNLDKAKEILEYLRSIGISISLDDFGTGYSTFSYLREFPVDILKIDRSFIKDMNTNANDGNIVQTIIRMASDLDMETVAEGVETIEQVKMLKRMGCTHLQGYLIRPPVEARNLLEVLAADNAEILCFHAEV